MSSLDRDKYAEVLRYLLSSEANNDKLGKVKLMKLLYYADFDHYAAHRQSLTGDRYFKLPYGPVPSKAEEILEDMCQRELLTIGQKPRYQYLRYVYKRPREGNIGRSDCKMEGSFYSGDRYCKSW